MRALQKTMGLLYCINCTVNATASTAIYVQIWKYARTKRNDDKGFDSYRGAPYKPIDGSATEQDLKRTKYLATELRYWLATDQSLKLMT